MNLHPFENSYAMSLILPLRRDSGVFSSISAAPSNNPAAPAAQWRIATPLPRLATGAWHVAISRLGEHGTVLADQIWRCANVVGLKQRTCEAWGRREPLKITCQEVSKKRENSMRSFRQHPEHIKEI